ncbi:BRO-N domain-containing protein [Pseudomonas solani]|uniref:BRO-N domain-containing protein n=1 Tax=Pseudomonas solani TaxID=2731552 RepID=UPI003F4ABBEE
MHDASTPIVFQRHNHQLRTVMVDNQSWFVAHDFARLIGALRPYCMTRLVDPHQRRVVVLRHASGGREEVLAISEAGAYRLLYRFNHPEHRGISRWLSEEVVPTLYDQHRDDEATPRRAYMVWAEHPVNALKWQGELWIARGDLPVFLAAHDDPALSDEPSWKRLR